MPIVTRLYPRHEDAARIVRALKTGGIEEADISLVASHGDVAAVTGAGAGAAAGSLIGALVGAGVDEEHAQRHVEDIKGGAVLVTVRADAANSLIAARIMDGDQR